MIDTNIDGTLLDDFQPGYAETFTVHLARKMSCPDVTRDFTRDGRSLLALSLPLLALLIA